MMDNSHDTKYNSSTSGASCCLCNGYGPNPDIIATRTYCSGNLRTYTSPSKASEKTAASPGDSVFVEGREASPTVGAEKIIWSWLEEGEAKASTNYYTIFSVRLFGDYNFDGAISSVDYAAANNLTEHGWPMLVASNMFHKVELKTDVLIPGYKILSLSGDAQIRVWTTANPTINDTPLLITGQTVTNGFGGASFGASPTSMLYVEALDSGVATLTYSYVGTGAAEGFGCSAGLGMTAVKVELQRNLAFSANNDLPNSDFITQIYGGPPVIGGPQEATVGGNVYMSHVVELEATINPNGLNLNLTDFGVRQTLHGTITFTYDNRESEIFTEDRNEGDFSAVELDRDGDGGGDTYFVIDGPGPRKALAEQMLINDSHMTSIKFKYDLTAYPTYKGCNCGSAFNWSVRRLVTKHGSTITWY